MLNHRSRVEVGPNLAWMLRIRKPEPRLADLARREKTLDARR